MRLAIGFSSAFLAVWFVARAAIDLSVWNTFSAAAWLFFAAAHLTRALLELRP